MSATTPQPASPSSGPWYASPLPLGLLGSLLLVFAQPLWSWSLLAWVAPLPWLYLATQSPLDGRRPYFKLWLAGFVYWFLAIHWIRLAHPATFFGLLLLAGYLGVYVPLFVLAVRTGVRKLGAPVWLVAPIVWVAIEWLQAHLLGGFLMAALGHTQIEQTKLVQIADLAGAYLISALVMLVAAAASELLFLNRRHHRAAMWRQPVAVLVATAALLGANWYGEQRLVALEPPEDAPTRRIALVQGNERAVWTADPDRDRRVMDHYIELTRKARAEAETEHAPIDLVVWPEGAFRTPMVTYAPGIFVDEAKRAAEYIRDDLAQLKQLAQAPLLVGFDRVHFQGEDLPTEIYNAAVAVDSEGVILSTYDKTHLVMFGEYVPFGSWWPAIYQLFPIGGVTPGRGPAAFAIDDVRYMPTICYETVIPHVVRSQVVELAREGQRPDVLVNITNDSWFYDSSELTMHLTCSRLRAIECRTPLVAAANGGLSANVDRCGRLLAVSQPMTPEVLMVDVVPGGAESPYLAHGDTFAIACLVVTVCLIAGGWFVREK